jgi:hypothetical protein
VQTLFERDTVDLSPYAVPVDWAANDGYLRITNLCLQISHMSKSVLWSLSKNESDLCLSPVVLVKQKVPL